MKQLRYLLLSILMAIVCIGMLSVPVHGAPLHAYFPIDGFDVWDQSPADSNLADGILTFFHEVKVASVGHRNYQVTALYLPGSTLPSGATTGFGVVLTDFTMTCMSDLMPTGTAPVDVIVEGSFSPGIPVGMPGLVTTHLAGSITATTDVERIYLSDLGTWSGPPASSGHIGYVVNPGYQTPNPLTTTSFDFGYVDSQHIEKNSVLVALKAVLKFALRAGILNGRGGKTSTCRPSAPTSRWDEPYFLPFSSARSVL